jgi:polar amino acid transport system substrate-binding protein
MNGNSMIIHAIKRLSLFLCIWGILQGLNAQEGNPQPLLRWGGDAESGAPYVFHDPHNYRKVIGYEVDIVTEVANRIGYKATFVQNDWDSLMPGLMRDVYDVVVDGFTIRPDLSLKLDFSIPYNISGLQLVVRTDSTAIQQLEDCKGKIVGTLKNSEAYKYLMDIGGIEIRIYEDEVNAYFDLHNKRLDAVFVDLPVALFYAGQSKALKFVGPAEGRLSYAMVVPTSNPELLKKINQALTDMIADGTLRRILEKWNLWSVQTAEYMQSFDPAVSTPTAYLDYIKARDVTPFKRLLERYVSFLPALAQAATITLQISMLSMVIAIILGLLFAIGSVYGSAVIQFVVACYIEIMRGTPLLIQLLFIFYALPKTGIHFSPFWSGVIGLGLNYAAFEAENYRAGIMSVPKGQMEAARALGMTHLQALRHVVVPQAIRTVIPPVTNDFISLIKDSSLVSVITIVELTKTYTQLATTYYDFFGIGILVASMYLLLGLPFVRLARWAEKRLAVETRKASHKTIASVLPDITK